MRLQAIVDSCLANPGEPALAVMKRWQRRAKRLRRRLSAVREIDVHLIKLAQLRARLTSSDKTHTQAEPESLRQLAAMEGRLKQDRRALAKKLALALRDRLDRLSGLSVDVGALLPSQSASSLAGSSHHLIAELQTAIAAVPILDAGSLHDFRKQIKKLRYVAEPRMQSDFRIAHFAQALKAMQDAIGEWHDWLTLAKEAMAADGATHSDLVAVMNIRVAESFEHAVVCCKSSIAELIYSREPDEVLSAHPARKPLETVTSARAIRRSA